MNDPSDLPLNERINRTMSLILFVAGALAFPSIVFLRRDIGRRYAGPQALLSAVLIFFWPAFNPTSDPRPMMYFLGAFLLMCVVSRIQGLRRKVGGDPVYRYYSGFPRLMRFIPCRSEIQFKRLHEPFILFCVGVMQIAWSPPLAYFVCASAVSLAITTSATEMASRERAEAMRDQLFEQQLLSERFRARGRN